MYSTILLESSEHIATIILNRPEIRNAFNEQMIDELKDCFNHLGQDENIRVVIIKGQGNAFSSGADLNWLRNIMTKTQDQNLKEGQNLALCLHIIYICPKPVISIVHGYSMGGANGILAACDIVYALDSTIFSFTEAKLGLVPANISPFVIKRIGEFKARELMLTGRQFNGQEAHEIGLVNKSFHDMSTLDQYLDSTIKDLLSAGPSAQRSIKRMVHQVCNHLTLNEARDYTARLISEVRVTSEAQEGMAAFLEKRKPNWNQ